MRVVVSGRNIDSTNVQKYEMDRVKLKERERERENGLKNKRWQVCSSVRVQVEG